MVEEYKPCYETDPIGGFRRMSEDLPVIYLARHGETAWSVTGQHTGRTDLPLTERGERNARRLGQRLSGRVFAKVFTSPSQRATRTCELAGFGPTAETDPNLVEWNYGDYEYTSSQPVIQFWDDTRCAGD